MIRTTILSTLTSLAMLAASTGVAAHEPVLHYDRINLSASAGRDVPTDTTIAIMFKQHQSSDQAASTDEVNQAITWAITQAKASSGIKVSTSAYRTQAIYRDQHIQAWRVFQTIRLESTDSPKLAALIGILQKRLAVQSLNNALSVDARKAAEEGLIAEALNSFQARARGVAQTLGRQGFRIVDLNINASGGRQQPMLRSAMAMESRSKAAAPSIEGGDQRVEVQINGTVELNAP